MRKIRRTDFADESVGPPNVFVDKRNWKWYGFIIIALVLAYASGLY